MKKIDIKSLTSAELEKELSSVGAERYRARQIFRWLYEMRAKHFRAMVDIPLELRRMLEEKFHITRVTLLNSKRSLSDGTAKYLLKLEDADTIEAVFLPEARRNTACISSQVGCKFRCSFCASSPFGFKRNLRPSEILDEILFIKDKNPAAHLTNLVFMGIGEPLDNYDNVMKAVRIINDKNGLNIGSRKITLSTCGIVPGINRLKEEGLQMELSVSLHSADDNIRSRLIPINKRYPLVMLIESCKSYTEASGRVITFEYVLIKNVNSSTEDAVRLARLLNNVKCKVNTISYNQVKAGGYQAPSAAEVKSFIMTVKDEGINVVHRKSRGEDIDAGCGQLRIARL